MDSGSADWTAAGTYQVAPSVYRIPLPLPNDGLRAVNVYAIDHGDSLTLIDAGWAVAETTPALERGLAELGYGFTDISRILVTHVHRDHYSNAVELRRQWGTHIALAPARRHAADDPADGRGHGGDRVGRQAARVGPRTWPT